MKHAFALNSQVTDIHFIISTARYETRRFTTYLATSGRPSIITLSFLGIAVGLFLYVAHEVGQDQLFLNEGRKIIAHVQTCEMKTSRTESYAVVTYIYAVEEHVYTGSAELRKHSSCDSYPAGALLTALYLISNPSTSRALKSIDAPTHRIMIYVFIAGSSLLIIFYLCLKAVKHMQGYWRQTPRKPPHAPESQQNLRRRFGTACHVLTGEITAVEGYEHERRFVLRVYYRFKTPHLITIGHYAEAYRDDLRWAVLPAPGTPVAILYADDHNHAVL